METKDIDFSKLSPMMKQYFEVKNKYKNHILFYRLGDFYEMFFDDAIIASRELELTLTGRDCGLEERAPMCGVPHHACDVYLKKLIEKGYNVAICEQTMDPAMCKGIVPREVIRVVTPGTLIESSMLDETSNNYICAFYMRAKESALCLADISTGEVHLFEFEGKEMTSSAINELSRFSPAEILINDAFLSNKELSSFIREKLKTSVQLLEENDFSPEIHTEEVLKQFSTNSLESIGVKPDTVAAFAAVLSIFVRSFVVVFADLFFLYFFLPVCLICYFITRSTAIRNAVLVVFSLIFYAWGEPVWVSILIVSSLVDYINGRVIEKHPEGWQAKAALAWSLVFNLGVLFGFKYTAFFVENLNNWFGLGKGLCGEKLYQI